MFFYFRKGLMSFEVFLDVIITVFESIWYEWSLFQILCVFGEVLLESNINFMIVNSIPYTRGAINLRSR